MSALGVELGEVPLGQSRDPLSVSVDRIDDHSEFGGDGGEIERGHHCTLCRLHRVPDQARGYGWQIEKSVDGLRGFVTGNRCAFEVSGPQMSHLGSL